MEQANLREVFRAALRQAASDIYLFADRPPQIRCRGRITALVMPEQIEAKSAWDVVRCFVPWISQRQYGQLRKNGALDIACDMSTVGRYRVNLFRHIRGYSAIARVIATELPDFASLNLPEPFLRQVDAPNGLVLVSGPTGSGKSTSLAMLLDRFLRTRGGHAITVEDPVEFLFESDAGVVHQREIGSHARSFAAALKAALREDPDILLIGELRDSASASLALAAAETGHTVLATLHASSSIGAIARLLDFFPANKRHMARHMLADSLLAILAQRFVVTPKAVWRVAIETLVATDAVRNLIREERTEQILSVMQTGRACGMRTMEQAVSALGTF